MSEAESDQLPKKDETGPITTTNTDEIRADARYLSAVNVLGVRLAEDGAPPDEVAKKSATLLRDVKTAGQANDLIAVANRYLDDKESATNTIPQTPRGGPHKRI